jgi:cobalt/nickel transport system permease protein
MHIPDGVLNTDVCLAAGVVSLGAVGYSLHQLKHSLADRAVPLTGMMSALVFAGQMVNFPIGLLGIPSVSGHLMGGVLAACVLGPWAGCLAITLVLVVQCFLFSDGGIMAMGANVLNMGVVGALGGYAVYAAVRRLLGNGPRGTIVGVVVAAWVSVMAAASLFCLEFGLSWIGSEDYSLRSMVALMVTVHSAIGVGEALITGSVVAFVLLQRPDLIYTPAATAVPAAVGHVGRALAAGLVFAFAVAAFAAPFASEFDDGLEAVAGRLGFDRLAVERVNLFADYDQVIPRWQKLSVSLSGILGTTAVFVIALVLERSLRLRIAAVEAKHE